MEWVMLALAGIFEIVWAISLKYTEGFTNLIASIINLVTMFLSIWFLSVAMRTLPLGISYAVWTGIGTIGTVLFGIFWLEESASMAKIVFTSLIVIGIVGLQAYCNA